MNDNLKELLFDELKLYSDNSKRSGGFIPAVKQLANVGALPGVVDVKFYSDSLSCSTSVQLLIHTAVMGSLLATLRHSI